MKMLTVVFFRRVFLCTFNFLGYFFIIYMISEIFSQGKVNWGKHTGLTYENLNVTAPIWAAQRTHTTSNAPAVLFLMCF